VFVDPGAFINISSARRAKGQGLFASSQALAALRGVIVFFDEADSSGNRAWHGGQPRRNPGGGVLDAGCTAFLLSPTPVAGRDVILQSRDRRPVGRTTDHRPGMKRRGAAAGHAAACSRAVRLRSAGSSTGGPALACAEATAPYAWS